MVIETIPKTIICKGCGLKTEAATHLRSGRVACRPRCVECNRKWLNAYNTKYYERPEVREDKKRRAMRQHKADPVGHYLRNERFRNNNPHKHYAKGAISQALRKGTITSQRCAVCGGDTAEAHHDDYSKPLDVIWLCKTHHGERHRVKNRTGEWPPKPGQKGRIPDDVWALKQFPL